MATQTKSKTRIKKNYVAWWIGPRGGVREKKFFTRAAADKEVIALKAAGLKGAKVRRQTAFKPNFQE